MDVHSSAAVSGNPVEDFLPSPANPEGGDGVSLEWLSVFVEDCLNGGFTTQLLPTPTTSHQTPNPQGKQGPEPLSSSQPRAQKKPSAQGPCKAKSKTKRRRVNNHHHSSSNFVHTFHVSSSSSDTPLLPRGYWLADSQLLTFHKKDTHKENVRGPPQLLKVKKEEEEELEDVKVVVVKADDEGQGLRRCTHCLSHKTPQWRAGPLGPRTLCNACGVRFKSGRLLPEYRPAKSPTFESFKHSNSHKKVMEMRMMATPLSSHNN